MRNFLDKILIILFTSVIMFSASENMQLVIMAFSMVTAAFMMSYFRLSGDFGRKVNVVLEILLALKIKGILSSK